MNKPLWSCRRTFLLLLRIDFATILPREQLCVAEAVNVLAIEKSSFVDFLV